jgi:polysaccharide pyruvyl transferase WcaK-like protein
MVKSLLLNDTSKYHNGCKVVVKELVKKYDITSLVKTSEEITENNLLKFDRIVLNGEGTMHHNQKNAKKFLRYLDIAQKNNIETYLVNSVWQDMSTKYNKILKNLKVLEVREVNSYNELKNKHNIISIIKPDESYFHSVVSSKDFEKVDIYEGGYFSKRIKQTEYPSINIFRQSWEEIVGRLKNSSLLITGRHHEMYAACVAECKFIPFSGNTWKMEGLLNSAEVDIPINKLLVEEVLAGKYDEEYNKLWLYLRSFK